MRIRRMRALALIVLFLIATGLMGCKPQKKSATQTPQPTQTAQASTNQNPLTPLLVEHLDKANTLLGDFEMKLESYKPKQGEPDYSELGVTTLVPFTDADRLLTSVLLLSYKLQSQTDGSFAYQKDGEQASLKLGQQVIYNGTEPNEDEQGGTIRQSATFNADGSRMTVQVFSQEQDKKEIEALCFQWVREGSVTRAQYYYTMDGGQTHNVIRYQFDDSTLSFAIYEDVEAKTDLFLLPSQDQFKQGYVTYGTYANNTATIQNEGHTLTVGP